jgi:hypothetical protein
MTKSTFLLIKLRAEVAMQQVLVEHGHQPRVYGRECPFCRSTRPLAKVVAGVLWSLKNAIASRHL